MNLKENNLKSWLERRGKVALALSGGVDSSVLLAYAVKFLEAGNVLALCARAPYTHKNELALAKKIATRIGVDFVEVEISMPSEILYNPVERCYFCKRAIFTRLLDEANSRGFDALVDGSNADDSSDYRPGRRALAELGIESPLAECGFTKADIRAFAESEGLENARAPANSCLMTRLSHGMEATAKILSAVEEGENILREMGYELARLRVNGNDARIEIDADKIADFASRKNLEKIAELKKLGFKHVSLDLSGYARGSMNI